MIANMAGNLRGLGGSLWAGPGQPATPSAVQVRPMRQMIRQPGLTIAGAAGTGAAGTGAAGAGDLASKVGDLIGF